MQTEQTGMYIRALRLEQGLTQQQLAQTLGITAQAVSKWERGLGSPDLSLLPELSSCLGVPIEYLLSGHPEHIAEQGGNMRNLNFYVCPNCGNLITATGPASFSCCGRILEPLVVQKPDAEHRLSLDTVEDQWFITSLHPMEKEHYLTFAALVTGDQSLVLRRWPEWDFQLRLPRRSHGFLYWYCTRHGLFRQAI